MLAEHRVEHAASMGQKFIVLYLSGVPLTIGHFEYGSEQIR